MTDCIYQKIKEINTVVLGCVVAPNDEFASTDSETKGLYITSRKNNFLIEHRDSIQQINSINQIEGTRTAQLTIGQGEQLANNPTKSFCQLQTVNADTNIEKIATNLKKSTNEFFEEISTIQYIYIHGSSEYELKVDYNNTILNLNISQELKKFYLEGGDGDDISFDNTRIVMKVFGRDAYNIQDAFLIQEETYNQNLIAASPNNTSQSHAIEIVGENVDVDNT